MWLITTQGFLSVVQNLDSRGAADALFDALDYPNFKSEVAKADPERTRVYMGVWSALGKLRGIH